MTLRTKTCIAAALILGGAATIDARADPPSYNGVGADRGGSSGVLDREDDAMDRLERRLRGADGDEAELGLTPDEPNRRLGPDVLGDERNPLDDDDDSFGGGPDDGLGIGG